MTKYTCHGVTRGGSRCARTVDNSGFCKDHPFDDGGLVTKTGFAKLQGVTQSAVSKWISDGTISESGDGYIDWKEATKALQSSRDFSRPLQRQGDKRDIVSDVASEPEDWGDLSPDEVKARYDVARMLKTEAEAKLAEVKHLEEKGKLVSMEDVQKRATIIGVQVRSKMMSMPSRLSGRLVSMTDQREIAELLKKEIRAAIESITDRIDEVDDVDDVV